jgi:hypothetical protein
MAFGSRAKGRSFENVVAKLIIETFAHKGILREHCYATPLSGGHPFASKTDPGDLQFSPKLAKLFPYSVECKSYKKLNLIELFTPTAKTPGYKRSSGKIVDWWKQCKKAAAELKRTPLLVMKQNKSLHFAMSHNQVLTGCGKSVVLVTKVDGDTVRVVLFEELLQFLSEKDKCGLKSIARS